MDFSKMGEDEIRAVIGNAEEKLETAEEGGDIADLQAIVFDGEEELKKRGNKPL